MINNSDRDTRTYTDRLIEDVDKKLLDFNLKTIALLGSLLYKPLATASDPFFRQNLGARYFTGASAAIGAFLWFFAGCLGGVVRPIVIQIAEHLHFTPLVQVLEKINLPFWIGLFFCLCYSLLAKSNLSAARERMRNGTIWHSMSRGETLFEKEDPVRELFLVVFLAVLLFMLAPPVAMLLVTSRFLSYYLFAKEQESMYARYMDTMDAQIMNNHLRSTLEKGLPPRETEGFYCPLPSWLTGEPRIEAANVIAGVPAQNAAKPKGASAVPADLMAPSATAASPVPSSSFNQPPQTNTQESSSSASDTKQPAEYMARRQEFTTDETPRCTATPSIKTVPCHEEIDLSAPEQNTAPSSPDFAHQVGFIES